MSSQAPIHYTVDPSVNPATWPGSDPTVATMIWKVDVIYININGDPNFRILRTGTNEHVHQAIIQATKHIARGVYTIVSMNVSDYSCMVVMSTEKTRDELMFKNGFPWDRNCDPQLDVVLK
ncbi:Ff.00g086240.m01.CDS01 [Fusarium sp. VM40]|nr:Ff.00g086240.m01.CDS01 [Fusarium sp. VM40]